MVAIVVAVVVIIVVAGVVAAVVAVVVAVVGMVTCGLIGKTSHHTKSSKGEWYNKWKSSSNAREG